MSEEGCQDTMKQKKQKKELKWLILDTSTTTLMGTKAKYKTSTFKSLKAENQNMETKDTVARRESSQ